MYRERLSFRMPFTVSKTSYKISFVIDCNKVNEFNITSILPIPSNVNYPDLLHEMETIIAKRGHFVCQKTVKRW